MHHDRGRILLVDGERHRADRLAARISAFGMDVHVAHNGAEGLLRAHGLHPDCIIATAHLPILDGFRMLEALRADGAMHHIPVFLITEGTGHEEVARGWKAGADLCIPSTLGEAELLATLRRALESARSSHLRHAMALAV